MFHTTNLSSGKFEFMTVGSFFFTRYKKEVLYVEHSHLYIIWD